MMHIHITPHHLSLTPSLRHFAAERIARLGAHVAEILAAHVVLLHERNHSPTARFSARVRLALRGPDVHAHESGTDLYAAIDKVADKLARLLRKRKTRHLRMTHPGRRFGTRRPLWPREVQP